MGLFCISLGILSCVVIQTVGQTVTNDDSVDPWVASVTKLPRKVKYDTTNDPFEIFAFEPRRLPTVGNGFIGHALFSDAVFMNGIYAGDVSSASEILESNIYRAKIPAFIAFKVNFSDAEGAPPINREIVSWRHTMDFRRGVYEETCTSPYFITTQRVYAHQRYNGLLVSELTVLRNTKEPWTIQMNLVAMTKWYPQPAVPDIGFVQSTPQSVADLNTMYREGQVGSSQTKLHIFYTPVDAIINIKPDQVPNGWTDGDDRNLFRYTYLMTIDESYTESRQQMLDAGTALKNKVLLQQHVDAWQEVWNNGSMDFEFVNTNGMKLAKRVYAAYYYILSSLPPLNTNVNPQSLRKRYFYGVGDGGLANGWRDVDYRGLVSWYHELMIFPVVLPFYPELAELMLKYRRLSMDPKRELIWGFRAARSGTPVVTPTCDQVCALRKVQALYLPLTVGHAVAQYVTHTGMAGVQWFADDGNSIMRGISDLIARRLVVNHSHWDRVDGYWKDYYDLPNVMGPDELHNSETNNLYTNALAMVVTNFGYYAQCLAFSKTATNNMDLNMFVTANKTMRLYLPLKRWPDYIHNQFEGFFGLSEDRQKASWADTVMAGYPVVLNMSEFYNEWHNQTIRWHDLEFYEQRITLNEIPIAGAIYGIGFFELDAAGQGKGERYFRNIESFVKEPFYLWSDFRDQATVGNVNYLPLAAAYIQMVLNGYLGLRLRLSSLDFLRPKLPPDISRVRLKNIKYRDTVLDINITDVDVTIDHLRTGEYALTVYENSSKTFHKFKPYTRYNFKRASFYINATQNMPCYFPVDAPIWGYNPYINCATSLQCAFLAFASAIVVTVFFNSLPT